MNKEQEIQSVREEMDKLSTRLKVLEQTEKPEIAKGTICEFWDSNEKPESTFNLTGFNEFVKENSNFLDSDIKVGIFAVGVLVKFLFDIQNASLGSTPFENKLRGYKLNPELLMNVYTEALDKIQKYQKNHYVYADLRDVVSQKFTIKSNELNKLTNNELSFYFVAGLELGKQFKNKQKK